MNLYRIKPYTGTENSYLESTNFNYDLIDALIDGEEINHINPSVFILKNKTKKLPDLLGTGSSELFISKRLKDLLEEKGLKQKIKYIPVTILEHSYFLLNIIGLRDCMNYSESIFTTFTNHDLPDKITSLIVNMDKIETLDLFRLKDKPIHIFITDKLRKELEEKEITGVHYIESMDLSFG